MIERRLVGRQVTTLGTIPAPFRTAVDGPRIITEGLVGHWDAGNPYSYPGTGTTWTDLSGIGNTGTLLNSPTFSSERGGAIAFDGTNQGTRCGTTGMNNADLNRSFEAVFHFNGNSQYAVVVNARVDGGVFEQASVSISGPTNDNWSFGSAGTTVSFTVLPSTGAGSNMRRATYALPSAGIYHVVGTSSSGATKLYVNGVLQSSVTTSQTGNLGSTSKKCGIGCTINASDAPAGSYFPSRIHLVRIYDRELTATEAFQNFQATRWRFGI